MQVLADGNDMSFGWRIVIEGAGSKASSPALRAGAPENGVGRRRNDLVLPVQK